MVHPELILRVEDGELAGLSFRGGRKRRVPVGRTKASAFQIKECSVSEKHALFEWTGEHWVLQDVGSSNGTSVDGTGLSERVPVTLHGGEVVLFGASVEVRVQIGGQEGVGEKPKHTSRQEALAAAAAVQVVAKEPGRTMQQEAAEAAAEEGRGPRMEGVAAQEPQVSLVGWLEAERERKKDRLNAEVQVFYEELKRHARELQTELCEYADLDMEKLPVAL